MKKRTIFLLPVLACIVLAYCGMLQNSGLSTEVSNTAKSSDMAGDGETVKDVERAESGETEKDSAIEKDNEIEKDGKTEKNIEKEKNSDIEKNSDMSESDNGMAETGNNTDGASDLPDGAEASSEELSEKVVSAPALPETGDSLEAFIPQGWEMKDSVSFDYNGDGSMDFVSVLEYVEESEDGVFYRLSPRILFAVYGGKDGKFRLDFQDINLIRARSEGGVFGDPYEPLTAEGSSFTIHSYGGSAWRWSEARTFTWRDGVWYLTLDESSYGYGWYVTHASRYDYDRGIGLQQRRSDEFSDMEKVWERMETEDMDSEEQPFDLTYEIALEAPPTLKQAGMRWWLAPDRMEEKPVDVIELAEDVELSDDQVELPEECSLFDDQDENNLLYHFFDEDSGQYYIALYQMDGKKLSVLTGADQEHFGDVAGLYQGKIYYVAEVRESDIAEKGWTEMEPVNEPETGGGKNSAGSDKEKSGEKKEDQVIGQDLYRMDLDGKNRQMVFGWMLNEEERENPPYLSMSCEFGRDEMVIEIYRGDSAHPFYRMSPDGKDVRFLGRVPEG